MLFLMKTEFKKNILNKKVFIVGLFTLAFFLCQIIMMGATNHSSYSLDRKYNHLSTIEDVKNRSFSAEIINKQFTDSLIAEYKVFVDENMQSIEKIETQLNDIESNETISEVLKNKYDPLYSGLIFDDQIKYGDNLLTTYFDIKFEAISAIENLKKEIDNKFYHEESNYRSYDYLSESQQKEMISLMQKNILEKPYIRGYSLGLEFFSSNMQFLPFTLGILLLVSLYGMFGNEKIKKTDAIILTCKEGKRKNIYAKILSVFVYASLLWLLFQLVNLIACHFIFTLNGDNVSVYSSTFNCIYGYNYLEYIVHQLPVSYLGTLLVAYIISLASQLLKPIPTLTIGAIWILLTSNVIHCFSNIGYTLSSKLMLLSPTQMMSSFNTYSNFTPYNLFGFNINLPSLTYILLFFGLLFSIIGLYYSIRNRQIKN